MPLVTTATPGRLVATANPAAAAATSTWRTRVLVTASRASACCVKTTQRVTAVQSAKTGTGVTPWRGKTAQVRHGLNCWGFSPLVFDEIQWGGKNRCTRELISAWKMSPKCSETRWKESTPKLERRRTNTTVKTWVANGSSHLAYE